MNLWVMWGCGAVVFLAVLIALYRVERGPSMLDRIVALDVVVAALVAGIALWSARTGRTDLLPLLAVLAIIGFVSPVTLARFAAGEPEDEGRILTREELAQLQEAGLEDLEAELEEERES